MSFDKPGLIEILNDVILINKILSPLLKNYVNSLGLKGNEKVLDFGSGSGAVSKYLASLLQKGGGTLTCLDTSRAWMEVARKRLRKYPNVEFITGDILKENIGDSAYDVVFIHFVLHDIETGSRQHVANALSKVLKYGGKLYIREPTRKRHGIPVEEIRQFMSGGGLKERHFEIKRSLIIGPTYTGTFEKVIEDI